MARNLYDDAGRLVGVIDGAGNTNRFIHDIANRIETVIDPLGFGLTNYYDPRGGITMTVNALGQTNQFSHNDDNRLIYAVNPLGHTNSYGYDENGYRDAITNELGEITRFDFDSFGQLLSKTDALTNTTSFEYNSTGRRTAVEDALGNRTSFTHDAFGRPTAVTNALQQLRAAAGSDELGDLLFVRQEGGLRMDFARDLNGNTTNTSFVWINPDNTNQTQNLDTITEFDPAGRITRVVDPDNLERLTVYDHAGRVQYSVNRMGSTNAFLYDALGNVIETSYEDGTVERSVYDARFQVLFTMDRHQPGSPANGTHNVYDALGRVTRTERLADVQIEINQNGVAPGSVLVSTGAVLAASSTAFDAAGRARFTTNALNHVTEFMYDDAGRQTVVIDALTNRTDYAYDEAGRLRFITNALDQAMRYDYDAKGRQIKIIFPDNSFVTNSYNEIGQLVAVKDQADLTTDNEYDGLGRLKAVLKPQVFDPEGGTNARPRVEYGYDSYGNIRTIRDPKGRETTFTYDSFGQLLSRELPLSQIESSLYNALGQLTNKVDFKGQTNRVAYDSLGRVATNWLFASGASTAGQTNSFEYLPNGRLFRITRPEGTTTFGYNLEGAVTNIVSPEGTLNYEYNQAAGYLTRVYTVKTDIQYAYDELSRLKTVTVAKRNGVTLGTPEVTTNTYTAIGQIENVYFPNGTRSFHEYDSLNYLTNLVQYGTGGQVLAHYKYTVASDGRRLAATERRLESGGGYSTNQITWNYDDVRRLTREEFASTISGLSYTNSYVYDLAGNRLWKTNMSNAGTEVISYDYNDNDQLLTEASSVNGTFTNYYDLNGSLTNRSSNAETNLYTYNLEGRLAIAVMLRMESGSSVQQTNNYFYNHTGI
ncbi:MAG: hypothetical protein KJ070_20340, partial [Verrucomicrobia bacterium]|nr:hypothetical protein [Verrucomicrobiota bacterium]